MLILSLPPLFTFFNFVVSLNLHLPVPNRGRLHKHLWRCSEETVLKNIFWIGGSKNGEKTVAFGVYAC